MRNNKIFRYILLLTLLVAFSLSCKVITKPFEDIIGIKETAESFATDVDIEGMATGFEGIVTEIGPMITEIMASGIPETMEAVISEIPDLSGEKPTDVPIIEGSSEMISTKGLIEFTTDKELSEVVDFYERQMPANGWAKTEGKVEEESAELVFQKEARKATVSITSIPFLGTSVTITIEGD